MLGQKKKEINRDEIAEVKKNNTLGTTEIIVGALAIAIIGPPY